MPRTSTATTPQATKETPVVNPVNRPAVATKNDDAQARLFKFVDNHGFYETLIMLMNYAESERAKVDVSDQPLRVYWRKLQNFVKDVAEKTFNLKV